MTGALAEEPIYVLTMRPRCIGFSGRVAPGSTKAACHKCGEEVWIAQSSLDAISSGYCAGAMCCHCAGVHSWEELTAAERAAGLVSHNHHWQGDPPRCACGTALSTIQSELKGMI